MATEVPSLDRLIDNYLLGCTAEEKSRKTIEWYEANLKRFGQFLKREHPVAVNSLAIISLRSGKYMHG